MSDRHPTPAEYASMREDLRRPGDGLGRGFGRPALEPIASRLERARRVAGCDLETWDQLGELSEGTGAIVAAKVWVGGMMVPHLVIGLRGVFAIWSIDCRWTTRQAAMTTAPKARLRAELANEGWNGQVEAVFHSPREADGWERQVVADPESANPIDIVIITGRISPVLEQWHPATEEGIDPEWIEWLARASEPRWWKSAEGRSKAPEIPADERG